MHTKKILINKIGHLSFQFWFHIVFCLHIFTEIKKEQYNPDTDSPTTILPITNPATSNSNVFRSKLVHCKAHILTNSFTSCIRMCLWLCGTSRFFYNSNCWKLVQPKYCLWPCFLCLQQILTIKILFQTITILVELLSSLA